MSDLGPRWTLAALVLLTFSIGVGEFVVMGLLPDVAAAFGVTLPAAGWTVTAYALGVAIGGPLVALGTLRVERRALLLGLGAVFLVGTVACALAPSFAVLLAARVLAAVVHGAFVGAAVVVATGLVPPERSGSAVAAVIAGFTVATVIGVPLGTWLGQDLGWRAVFWTIAGIAMLGWIAVAALLHPQPVEAEAVPDVRRELAAVARPEVLGALATTALGFGGLFAAFTYVAAFLTEVSGFGASAVPGLLFLFGAGALIGNVAGGPLADRAPGAALLVPLAVLSVTLVALPVLGESRPVVAVLLVVLGAAAFGATPALQLGVMRAASEAPFLASTLNVTAFNAGNALGAFLGGLVVAATGSARSTAWVGAVMTVCAIVLALHTVRTRGRGRPGALPVRVRMLHAFSVVRSLRLPTPTRDPSHAHHPDRRRRRRSVGFRCPCTPCPRPWPRAVRARHA